MQEKVSDNMMNSVTGVIDNHIEQVTDNADLLHIHENKCFIFDVDGTLADCTHRLKYLNTTPKDWKSFIDGAVNDRPFKDIIWLLNLFHEFGHAILIVTGRGEESREVTNTWLDETAGLKGKYHKI